MTAIEMNAKIDISQCAKTYKKSDCILNDRGSNKEELIEMLWHVE